MHLRTDPVIKCRDGLVKISSAKDHASGDLRPDHIRRSGPRLTRQSVEARDPRFIHELIDLNCGDDLPVQPMLRHLVGIALLHRTREVGDQSVQQVRVIWQVRRQDLVLENDFRVGEQRRQFR